MGNTVDFLARAAFDFNIGNKQYKQNEILFSAEDITLLAEFTNYTASVQDNKSKNLLYDASNDVTKVTLNGVPFAEELMVFLFNAGQSVQNVPQGLVDTFPHFADYITDGEQIKSYSFDAPQVPYLTLEAYSLCEVAGEKRIMATVYEKCKMHRTDDLNLAGSGIEHLDLAFEVMGKSYFYFI